MEGRSVVRRAASRLARRTSATARPEPFPGVARYWDRRYAEGGTSGAGSYGVLAEFKAQVLNDFVERHAIRTVTELGCGDGHQLSLARYPSYRGLDVAASAIDLCASRFAADPTKSFYRYDPSRFHDRAGLFRSDLALSLDVVFHLVDDAEYERYMGHLFDCGGRFVAVYSSDSTEPGRADHVRHRRFTQWVAAHRPGWLVHQHVENPYRGSDDSAVSDFWFYAAPPSRDG